MGRLVTAAPALIYGAAVLAFAIAAVIRSLRNASQRIDDILGEENPKP